MKQQQQSTLAVDNSDGPAVTDGAVRSSELCKFS